MLHLLWMVVDAVPILGGLRSGECLEPLTGSPPLKKKKESLETLVSFTMTFFLFS